MDGTGVTFHIPAIDRRSTLGRAVFKLHSNVVAVGVSRRKCNKDTYFILLFVVGEIPLTYIVH